MIAPAPTPPADPTAVIGRRILAYIIDGLIATAVVVAVFAGVASSEERGSAIEAEAICDILNNVEDTYACINFDSTVVLADGGDIAIVALAWLVTLIANFLILPSLTGFSLGKAVVGLRVVNGNTFEKAGFGAHLIRLLVWVVDTIPWCFPLVGLITGLSSSGHRRVGDMAASTLVIDKQWVGHPLPVAGVNNVAHTGAPSAFGTPAPPAFGTTPPPPGSTIGGAPPPPPGMAVPAASPPPPPGAGIIAPPAFTPPPPQGFETPPVSTPPPTGAPVFPAPPSGDGTPPPPPITEPDPPVEPDMDATTAVEAVSPTGDRTTDETTMIAPVAMTSDDDASAADAPSTAEPSTDAPGGDEPEPPASWTATPPVPEVTPPPPPAAPEPEPEPEAVSGVGAPQWDAARDTYIQWDPELNEWMEWSESAGSWIPISR